MICSVATRSSAVVRDELVHPTNRRMYERILVVISHKYIDPSLKREYELSDRKTYDCIAWPVASLWPAGGARSLSIDREAGRAISLKVNLRGSGARICDASGDAVGPSPGWPRCLPHMHMAEARAATSVRGQSARRGGSAACCRAASGRWLGLGLALGF